MTSLLRILRRCRDATQVISEGLDHPLPWSRWLASRVHLAMCSACRAYRRQIINLDRLLRQGPHDQQRAQMSQETRERIKRTLRERGGSGGSPPAV